MDALGQVASTAIDLCGWALDCDKIGQDAANSLHELCPDIFSGIGIYWRSNVVIAGMVISGIATIAALVEGVIGVALATFACFLILSFSLYYISRYAEIAEMGAKLGEFEQENQKFTQENQKFAQENQNLSQTVQVLSKGTDNLEETVALAKKLTDQITTSLTKLERIRAEITEAESTRIRLNTESQLLQSELLGKTQTILAVTKRHNDKLAETSISLQNSADRGDVHAKHLQDITHELKQVVAGANGQPQQLVDANLQPSTGVQS